MIQGNLPVKLIYPLTFHNILRNVTLQLPDGFELIFVTKTENIHQYYQIGKVTVVAKVHQVKLLISMYLKAEYHHPLKLIVAVPSSCGNSTFLISLLECWRQLCDIVFENNELCQSENSAPYHMKNVSLL